MQAKAGDRGGAARSITEALAIVRSITDDSDARDGVLDDIVVAQVKMGDIAGALDNARRIVGFVSRLAVFNHIAEAQAKAGDRRGAIRSHRRDPKHRREHRRQ